MSFFSFNLISFEGLREKLSVEKILNILSDKKIFIYEALFLSLFLAVVYFLINYIFINTIYNVLSHNKKVNVDRLKTIIKSFRNLFSILVLVVFLIFFFNKLGININTLLTSAGILGATLLIIFQNSIRDFLSGWFFVVEDTFREGEYIVINNTFKGRVYNLRSRYLVLRGDSGELVMIPYGQINFVHNFSRKRIITKLTIKIRKENYSDSKVNDFRSFLTDLSNKNPEIGEPEIIDIYEVGENYIEVLIRFKVPFSLASEAETKLKKEIFNKFGDIIIEIKDAA